MMTPGGLGPYFCGLFCNSAEKSKKQTHLVVHTFPHLACDMLNRSGQDRWVMLLKIGPFDSWSIAVAFLEAWMSRKRGKQRRLERGIELFLMYRVAYDLRLWSQAKTREERELLDSVLGKGTKNGVQQDEDNDNDDDDDANGDGDEVRSSDRPVKKQRTKDIMVMRTDRTLHDVRQSFAPGLTLHGLVAICSQDLGIANLK